MDFGGKTLRAYQVRGHSQTVEAVDAGAKRICVTSPTGGGKTLLMGCLADHFLQRGKRVVLLTNRKMLATQTIDVMRGFGLDFGVRAAGMEDLADASKPFQISMVQTEQTRKRKRLQYELPKADVALIDEAHNQATGGVVEIIEHYDTAIGYTATPLGIGEIYKRLITAGVHSELRDAGAIVRANCYGPDEPMAALRLKRTKTGEFNEGDVVKAIMSPTIFGRVHEHYNRLNPDRRPSILFAPGVQESIWFAEQFKLAGIRAAHIDGESVWIDGEQHNTTQDLRDEVLRESRSGAIQVLCNRFVLREGIDAPWLYHGILATIFGSVTSYLQSVGRLLRAFPGLDHVVLQDHGGNWWRHGSPNADRIWDLSLDAARYAAEREQRIRDKKLDEPIVCPKCGAVRNSGPRCITCGHETTLKSRPVIQEDGTLKYLKGDIFKERVTDQRSDTEKLWERTYWRCRNSNMTFGQAYGLFYQDHGYSPPKSLPLMPREAVDWHAKIKAVPRGHLIPKDEVKRASVPGLFG
jgi:superfamily II DNA or RNA helicase